MSDADTAVTKIDPKTLPLLAIGNTVLFPNSVLPIVIQRRESMAALDAATPYYHPLVKTAKDVAAGAVLLTALLSIAVGLLILGPPLCAKIAAW